MDASQLLNEMTIDRQDERWRLRKLKTFTKFFLSLLVMLCTFKNVEPVKLQTDKEAWLVANKRHSITCMVHDDIKEEFKVHWAKKKSLISTSNDVNVKEKLINKTIVQLIFINASVFEAGEYNCIADNGLGKRINSTIHIHVGGPPVYSAFDCHYDKYNGQLWVFPIFSSTRETTRFDIKYRKSIFPDFCKGNITNSTICGNFMSRYGCYFGSLAKNTKYCLKMTGYNKYGNTSVKRVLPRSLLYCLDNYPKIRTQLLDDNSIIVDFEFVNVILSSDVIVSIREDQTSKQIESYKPFPITRKMKYRFKEKLLPCTLYHVCVRIEFFLAKKVYSNCTTEETTNYFIAPVNHIQFSENSVKKTLQVIWQDPGSEDEGTFFYNVTMKITNNAIPLKSLGETVPKRRLTVPFLNGTKVDVKIVKCTKCGCGAETSAIYDSPIKPSRAKRVAKPETSSYVVPLVAFGVCLAALLTIALVYVIWRQRTRRQPPGPDPPPTEELGGEIIPVRPLSHHDYEEVSEIPHYYEKVSQEDDVA